ncbi:hypothetical protein DPMN_007580 [Dreissena polymorpha]|uniref:Uncharacterized protein n=1 Tax=Dreissena polymorpha TaxID=45954 RepID=A0A9D4RYD7_DREPO|nr:hypothetical protein DPMN_007580 [Dreissena polymorpha]
MRNLPVRVSLNVNSTLNQSLSLSRNKSKTLHQTMYPTLAVQQARNIVTWSRAAIIVMMMQDTLKLRKGGGNR